MKFLTLPHTYTVTHIHKHTHTHTHTHTHIHTYTKSSFKTSFLKILVTLVTNYHKSSLFTICGQKPTKLVLNFESFIVTSNKLYFPSLHERFKCTANKYRELNFRNKFYSFMQLWECIG